jgi:hypothetical protein
MDLETRLKKRYKAISNIDFYITESIYYRNNNYYFNEKEKKTICNIAQQENKVKII